MLTAGKAAPPPREIHVVLNWGERFRGR